MTAANTSVWRRIRQITTRTAAYGEHGGPVRDTVDDPDNLRGMECRHLLILVHGYNNTTTQANNSFVKQIGLLKKHFSQSRYAPDAIAFFHWPGNYGARGLSLFGYPEDIERAIGSASRLANYLTNFPRPADPGAFKVTIVGHSLGCRLILEMLARLPNTLNPNVQVVSLMAPAVPTELVDTGGALQTTVLPPRNLLKCYSHQDLALSLGFPLMQWAAHRLEIEPRNYREAVGLHGKPFTMRKGVQTHHGHSDYWDDEDVANEYLALIDPNYPSPSPPRQLARRSLAEHIERPSRHIGSRRL